MKRLKNIPEARIIGYVVLLTLLFIDVNSIFTPLKVFGIKNYNLAAVIGELLITIIPILYLIIIKGDFVKSACLKPVRFSTILFCVLIYFCQIPITGALNSLTMMLVPNVAVKVAEQSLSANSSLLVTILCTGVITAVLEELCFRGSIHNGLKKSNPGGAVFLSALIFALMHLNLNQFAYAFVVGVELALLIEVTGSIIPGMFLHMLMNSASMIMASLYQKIIELAQKMYLNALETGDSATAQALDSAYGFSNPEKTVASMADSLANADNGLLFKYFLIYLIPAVIGGFLIFLIIRHLAKKSGRLDYFKWMFASRKNKAKYEAETLKIVEKDQCASEKQSMFSIPLVLSIIWMAVTIIAKTFA